MAHQVQFPRPCTNPEPDKKINCQTPSACRTGRRLVLGALTGLIVHAAAVAQEFPNNLSLLDVWGTSPTDVWVAGVTDQAQTHPGLYHFDGESWTEAIFSDDLVALVFPQTPSDIIQFQTISGNASNNIYAVGTRNDQAGRFVARFDGSEWKLHAHISSDQYISSWVDPETGDVYIGGRAFSGGGSIIRKATGGAGPTDAAGTAFAIIASSSAYGFGVTSIGGLPHAPMAMDPGEVFFATTNGMFQFGGTSTGVVRPLIDGWGSYPLPAVGVFPALNETGDPDVLVANANGVAAFTWNGTTLTANGDTGVAPSFYLGTAGSSLRVAAYHSILEGGAQGDLDNVFVLQNVNDEGQILKYNFGTMTWAPVDSATVPLRDFIVFPDGTYFAVGDGGTVITNFAVPSNDYVWDNTVEAQGDHNFHGSTGGPTNWLIGNSNERHATIVDGADFVINNGSVQITVQSVIANSINATGSLTVNNGLTLGTLDIPLAANLSLPDGSHQSWSFASVPLEGGAPSSIANISLNANLTLGGDLTLTGPDGTWTAGNIAGTGTLKNSGTFTINPSGGSVSLALPLVTQGSATTKLQSWMLDLGATGSLDVLAGGRFELAAATIGGGPSNPGQAIRNRGDFVKTGTGTAHLNVTTFVNDSAGSNVVVEGGTLEIAGGGGDLAGTLETQSGATTWIHSATMYFGGPFEEPLKITGPGQVRIENSTIQAGVNTETTIENSGSDGGLFLDAGNTFPSTNYTLHIIGTGRLRQVAGTHKIDGKLVVDGLLEVEGGKIEAAGMIEAKGLIDVNGGELVLDTPAGRTNLIEGGDISVESGAKVSLTGGGTFALGGRTNLTGNGTIELDSSLTLKIGGGFSAAELINELKAKPLRLNGATLEGSGTTPPNYAENRGFLTFDSGSVRQLLLENDSGTTEPAVLAIGSEPGGGPGALTWDEVRIVNTSRGVVRQSKSIGSGENTLSNGLTIENSGRYEVTGASLIGTQSNKVVFTNNTGTQPAELVFSGESKLEGTLDNSGVVIVENGAKVDITDCPQVDAFGSNSSLEGGIWEIRGGSIDIKAVDDFSLNFSLRLNPLVAIGEEAELRFIGPSGRFNPAQPAADEVGIFNRGKLTLSGHELAAPLGRELIEGELLWYDIHQIISDPDTRVSVGNRGTITLDKASIVLQEHGILLNGAKALITGNGKIEGTVASAGEIVDEVEVPGLIVPGKSPGTLEITGDFLHGRLGVIRLELGGLEPGYDHDQLIVGGTAAFLAGSRIEITLIDPNPDDDIDEIFIPRDGDTFALIDASNIEIPMGMTLADFVEFTNLPAGVVLNPQLDVVNGRVALAIDTDSTLTPPPGPRITSHPKEMTVTAGEPTELSVEADGATNITYQWQLDGVDIPGATEATYELPSAQSLHAGEYTVVVTADGASTTSRIATLDVEEPPPSNGRLVNLSTRAWAGSGEGTLILGFYVAGTGSKTVVIRGLGPQLLKSNVPTVVADPAIVLYSGSTPIAQNDDWDPALAPDFVQVGAPALDAGSKDAAMKVTLSPGPYTVHLVNSGPLAEGLVEIFDLSNDPGTRLVNLSTRLLLSAGETIIVGTYVLNENVALPVLVRAAGPGLEDLDVAGFHPDPQLRVYTGQTPIGSNDDWDPSLGPRFAEVGAFGFDTDSKDAAARVALKPGAYTMHATGNGEGVILVELYGP